MLTLWAGKGFKHGLGLCEINVEFEFNHSLEIQEKVTSA